MRQEVIQKAPERAKKQTPNLTGIPTQMKLDFERRSGLSFDDVRVHYNSDKPRKIGALAYTQIPQVHIGPGQERHLRHELGHVVQQKQGIVRPTTWINGLPVNDSPGLEHSASELPQLSNHSTGYSPFHNTRGTVQMLAHNPPSDGGDEQRYRITNITPDARRPAFCQVTCKSITTGGADINYSDNISLWRNTILYLTFQKEWIMHYLDKLDLLTFPGEEWIVLHDALASATNMGEDAYFLLRKKVDARNSIIDSLMTHTRTNERTKRRIKEIINKIVNDTRHATGKIQDKVFSFARRDTFLQTHHDAVDTSYYTGGVSLEGVKTGGKDVGQMSESRLPTCIAYIQLERSPKQEFVCLNSKTRANKGLLPKYIHPLLAASIRSLTVEAIERYRTTKGVGTHAEIYTVNKLLKKYVGAERIPRGTRLHIIHPVSDTTYRYFGRCAHCHDIIDHLAAPQLSMAFAETMTQHRVTPQRR